jgi:hypothetical protein
MGVLWELHCCADLGTVRGNHSMDKCTACCSCTVSTPPSCDWSGTRGQTAHEPHKCVVTAQLGVVGA